MKTAAALGVAFAASIAWSLLPRAGGMTPNAAVDAVFSRFDRAGSPGCALGILQDGSVAYARGYGLASVEHGVPIGPDTVFDIGSVSKQFTAMSVLLLERDGKLSLDDDIRKYLPEIPDYGRRISIRHLLTHTSGLRDYNDLLELDGHDVRDHTTDGDALDIIVRQRGVNFAPGDEWRYSNTGFFLASVIVKRVSGRSLASFARERIFEPLHMSSTQYLDDTRRIVAHRAEAYDRDAAGFLVDMSNWDQTGDGAVQTTVADMAKWAANYDTPVVGDRRIIDAMQTAGRLNNGKPHGYGLGLRIDNYRGLRRIEHGGSWAGYRAMLSRFPDQHAAIIILCNVDDAGTSELADGVADAWLERARLTDKQPEPRDPAERATRPPFTPALAALREYAGRYAAADLTVPWDVSPSGQTVTVRVRKGDGIALTAVAADRFDLSGTAIEFLRDPKTRAVTSLRISNRGVENLILHRQPPTSSSFN